MSATANQFRMEGGSPSVSCKSTEIGACGGGFGMIDRSVGEPVVYRMSINPGVR